MLTVDTPLLGARDRDRRTGRAHGRRHAASCAGRCRAIGRPPGRTRVRHERIYNPHLDPSLTWETLEWLVDLSPVPVLAKGVVRADDARHCVDAGAGGVIVSNHGARNLDTVVATAEALPGVVRAVDGAVPVLVDGGIRRGTDIAKALILGADAVLVGRPIVWGLTVAGADGVQWVVETLWSELAMAMGLLGAATRRRPHARLDLAARWSGQRCQSGACVPSSIGIRTPTRGRCRCRSRSRRRHAG